MKIEIQGLDKMSMSGDAVLEALQNNQTPKADLFIREAIQNSLDASKTDATQINIELEVSTFESEKLTSHLELVGDSIQKLYPGQQEFLSIRDYNTTGLTGVTLYSEVIDHNQKGNFLKLIYGIANAQEKAESGGSWGYGKTIFYRMGIGLVVYYTRIELNALEFEERLVIAMIENQNDLNSLIPPKEGTSAKTGIAWWGNLTKDGKSIPITNHNEIIEVLSIFSIKPYEGDETGTLIIMPYISSDEILSNNEVELDEILSNNEVELDEKLTAKKMYGDLETYLNYSIQRWYSPRLNNYNKIFGNKALEVLINRTKISDEDINPYYRKIRDMYNFTQLSNGIDYNEEANIHNFKKTDIILNNVERATFDNTTVGQLVYATFSYSELGMNDEFARFNPYYLSNISGTIMEDTPAIITYCRKPGMLINFEIRSDWSNNVNAHKPGEYIIGIFVLNSESKITLSNHDTVSLEEYVRQSEQADHNSWADHNKFGDTQTIIKRIKSSVRRDLSSEFEKEVEVKNTSNADRLGEVAADYILPKEGFGKGKPIKKYATKKSQVKSSTKLITSTLFLEDLEYEKNCIYVPFKILVNTNNLTEISFEVKVSQENGTTNLVSYENDTGIPSPVEIASVVIDTVNLNRIHKETFFSNIDHAITDNKKIYKECLSTEYNEKDILIGKVKLNMDIRDVQPIIEITGKGGS